MVSLAYFNLDGCGDVIFKRPHVLQQDLTLKGEEMAKEGKCLKGRQALLMIYNGFSLDEARGALFGVTDLTNIKYKGDDHMETFWKTWCGIIGGLKDPLPESQLEQILVKQRCSVYPIHYIR